MSLIFPDKSSAGVFDKPPIKTGKKSFFARRFISLAGKPVLAEKNMPVAPSSCEMARKCFACPGNPLYKTNHTLDTRHGFKPYHSNRLNNDDFYESHQNLPFFRNSLPQPVAEIRIGKPEMQIVIRQQQQNLYLQDREAPLAVCLSPSTENDFNCSSYRLRQLFSRESRLKEILYGQDRAQTPDKQVVCDVHKGRSEGICARFSQGEFFTPWENEIRQAQTAFASLCPVNRTLALRTTSFEQATGPEHFFHPSTLARKKAIFTSNAGPEPIIFANGRELIGNLILEHHIKLEPVVLLRVTGNKMSHALSQKLRQKNHREPECIFSHTALPKFRFSQPAPGSERQALSLSNNKLVNTFQPPEMVIPEMCWQNPRAIFRKISGYHKIKFRLRLRLIREQLPANDFSMQIISGCISLPVQASMKKTVETDFLPMRSSISNYCSFRFLDTALIKARTSDHYMQKRSPFMVTSARHARYTLNCLKKLVSTTKTPGSVGFSNSCGQWIQQACMSAKVKPADSFSIVSDNPEPIKNIKLRPASFLMYVTAPSFTDICLPEHKRRLKAPRGLFPLTAGKSFCIRRKTTLRLLRFRLFPIHNGFVGDRTRALRKISNNRTLLPIVFNLMQKFALHPSNTIPAKLSSKNPLIASRLKLRPSVYRHHLPAQAKVAMALDLSITGIKALTTLQQKDFIVPQGWPISSRLFNCKLKLSPYPFGFPAFLPDIAHFTCLEKQLKMKHCNEPFARAKACCEYILRREKPVHSVLSMKNPRRLIHRSLGPVDFPGDYFVESCLSQPISIKSPEKLLEFPHQWFGKKLATENQSSGLPVFSGKFCGQQPVFAVEIGRQNHDYAVHACQVSTNADMPRVKRLLLRAKRFKGKFFEPFQPQVSLKKAIKCSGIKISPVSTESLALLDCNHSFFFNDLWEPSLNQSFSPAVLAENIQTAIFQARFRLFRFPYRPETTSVNLPATSYPHVEDTPAIVDNFFSDEVRAREFNFCFSSIKQSLQHYKVGLTRKTGDKSEEFALSSGNPCSTSFIHKFRGKELPIRTFPVEFIQQFDLTRLLKPSYSGFFRFKKVIRPVMKFASPLSLSELQSRLKFSQSHEKRIHFRGMNTTSPHWVILLRSFEHANPPAMNFSCITLSAAPCPTGIFCYTGHTQIPDFHFASDLRIPMVSTPRQEDYTIKALATETIFMPPVDQPFIKSSAITSRFVEDYELPGADLSSPVLRKFEIFSRPAANFSINVTQGMVRGETPDYQHTMPFPQKKLQFSASFRINAEASFRHAAFPDWYDLETATIAERSFRLIGECRSNIMSDDQSDDQPG